MSRPLVRTGPFRVHGFMTLVLLKRIVLLVVNRDDHFDIASSGNIFGFIQQNLFVVALVLLNFLFMG